jgi:hypothetical protein
MTLPIFPSNVRGLTYPVTKTPGFNTVVQSAPNLLATTVAQTYNPAWTWELIYEFLKEDPNDLLSGSTYTDYRLFQGFLLQAQGQANSFLFDDPTDDYVGPALILGSPNPHAQLQLVNDGAGNYYSPIQRNFGGQFYEDITDLNGAIAVYANGILQNSVSGGTAGAYTIVGPGLALPGSSYMGLVIKWAAMPTGPINAQFNFYFRVRFPEDKTGISQFSSQHWTIGGSFGGSGSSSAMSIMLTSSRPVQV